MSQKAQRARPPVQLTEIMEVSMAEINALIARGRQAPLSEADCEKIQAMGETLIYLKAQWQAKGTAVRRLLRLLFGARSEKTDVVTRQASHAPADPADRVRTSATSPPETRAEEAASASVTRKGHGRNGAAALTGALKVPVPHPMLTRGEGCPECSGKVYPFGEPKKLVRIVGVAPLMAAVYECEQLRCNACLELFTAPAPEGIGEKKYDETATATIGLLRYDAGLPHNQLEKLQQGMGIPCSVSTQWDLVEEGGETLEPAQQEMIRQGAQGTLQHSDDTCMRILQLTREERAAALGEDAAERRTGVFTTAIVSVNESVRIALFFTGARHAGENLNAMLKRRAVELPPPIQMCDASANNRPKDYATLLANCMSHARRRHVEVEGDFPNEVRFVLETLREVYFVDAEAREAGLSDNERLRLHQDKSKPWITGLKNWMHKQLDEKLIEPNSGLGEAITYMQENWRPLTAFLRIAGAPLDNNLCERVLKKAIRHRKNSLYYRTANGARIGDIWMSMIHTAELNGVSAFEYLVALLRHPEELKANPSEWMPWTFRMTLERMKAAALPAAEAVAA
jgi:transposase